jgi:hypothetical protein
MLLHSSRLPPAPIQDHATAKVLLPCTVPWLKNAAPDPLPQDVVRIALTLFLNLSGGLSGNSACSSPFRQVIC